MAKKAIDAVSASGSKGVLSGYLLFSELSQPTITMGYNCDPSHLLASPRELRKLGIELVSVTGRGGQITLHHPGQWLVYPVLPLRGLGVGVKKYVELLGLAVGDVLKKFGLSGELHDDYPGVWVERRGVVSVLGVEALEVKKNQALGAAQPPTDGPVMNPSHDSSRCSYNKICAVGLRVSRGVVHHGFALNVGGDLSLYDHIIPCGLSPGSGRGVTSIEEQLLANGRKAPMMDELISPLLTALAERLGLEFTECS